MNEAHQACGGDEWRGMMRNVILPWAIGEVELGDDVIEVGPGYGATTDVFRESIAHITSVEIDEQLARMLTERFADARRTSRSCMATAPPSTIPTIGFSGAACFTMLHHVPTTSCKTALRGGGPRAQARRRLVASDSLASDELASHHEDDTYNPVDPASLEVAAARRGVRCRSRCAPTRSGGRRSRGLGVCEARISASLISHLCSHSRPCWYITPLRRSMCSRKPGPPHSGQRVGFPQTILGAGGGGVMSSAIALERVRRRACPCVARTSIPSLAPVPHFFARCTRVRHGTQIRTTAARGQWSTHPSTRGAPPTPQVAPELEDARQVGEVGAELRHRDERRRERSTAPRAARLGGSRPARSRGSSPPRPGGGERHRSGRLPPRVRASWPASPLSPTSRSRFAPPRGRGGSRAAPCSGRPRRGGACGRGARR